MGHQCAMAAHVGGESTAFGAPSEPREGAEESHFEGVFGVRFLDHIRDVLLEALRHKMGSRMRLKMGHFCRWLTKLKCSK